MYKLRISQAIADLRSKWAFASETQRDHARILAGVIVLMLVALAGYFLGKPYWKRWQLEKSMVQAEEFAQKRDYRSALLALHRASALGMDDAAVWKQVAALLSDLHSPEVLIARRNLVALTPTDMNLRLALVTDALRFGEIELAKEILETTPGMGKNDAAFHRMAAVLAYATGVYDQLDEYLAGIVAKEPGNGEALLNLSAIRLWNPEAAKSDAAKKALLGLVDDPKISVRASLELLKFVARTGVRRDADDLIKYLVTHLTGRNAELPVGGSMGAEPAYWFDLIEELKKASTTRSTDAAALCSWLSSVGMAREAYIWVQSLSPELRTAPLLRMAELDLALRIDHMERIRELLQDEKWLHVGAHIVDLAFAARWQDRNSLEAHSKATWGDAVQSASNSLPALRILVRLASAWGMEDAKLNVLWIIVQRYPAERWACEALRSSYMNRKDTERLWQLYRLWAGRSSSDRKIAFSWLMLSFLLERADTQLHQQAKELWQKDPTDPAAAVCYAASLRLQKQVTRAMGVMDALPVESRSNPRVALWRSILLVDSGRGKEAESLMRGIDPKQLLDEEERLLLSAGGKLRLQASPKTERKSSK